ncbi:MAG: hypothetical protein HY695_20030 [Deltaproteobacteria bacterium]|nr:hypothetical protein [Deltaproteobacteria bacterium]
MTSSLYAADRTDVPLKNWGGFSIQRSWVYDALEKIVLAGLAERVVLNTKPLSRVEAARVVAEAVRRIRDDQYGDYNHRGYLEETVYHLVEEFGPELAEMGVRTPLNREARRGFLSFRPVEHTQFGIGLSSRSRRLINDFGQFDEKGGNPSAAFDGRVQLGDYLSFYYEPQVSWDAESYEAKLMSGYTKFTFRNIELMAGRESVWWGPGYRGSMSFSNNAFPLDQVRVGSAEPFRLPWYFKLLGPIKISTFVAQLDEHRDFPNAKVSGLRIALAPRPRLEIGFNRIFQFGGDGKPSVKPAKFIDLFFFRRGCDEETPDNPLCINNVLSIDATVRLPDVNRYIPLARDMALYFDFGWDDTQGGDIIPQKPGGIAGIFLTGFLGDPQMDFRFEYARTSNIQFNHVVYTSGFTNRGAVLSHFIGTDGRDIYARVSRWMNRDLHLGLQASHSQIGRVTSSVGAPKEQRTGFGFDVSYRFSNQSSLFLGYEFAKVKDRDFVLGKSANDHLFQLEFSRSFDFEW